MFEHTGPAYLDKIVFAAIPEDSARLGSLESGQIDSLHYVQPSEETRLIDEGWNLVYADYLGTPINIVLRPEAEIVDDVRVRQALQVGIDREDLVSTVYNENWNAATSTVQKAAPGWVDLSDELAYDPDAAEDLLDAAGWSEKNADGIRVRDGQTLTLPGYTSPNLNTSPSILELVAQQLKDIGIDLQLSTTDATTYVEIFNSPATPAITTANTFLDIATLKQYWGTTAVNQFKLTTDVLDPFLLDVAETTAGTPRARCGRAHSARGDGEGGVHDPAGRQLSGLRHEPGGPRPRDERRGSSVLLRGVERVIGGVRVGALQLELNEAVRSETVRPACASATREGV